MAHNIFFGRNEPLHKSMISCGGAETEAAQNAKSWYISSKCQGLLYDLPSFWPSGVQPIEWLFAVILNGISCSFLDPRCKELPVLPWCSAPVFQFVQRMQSIFVTSDEKIENWYFWRDEDVDLWTFCSNLINGGIVSWTCAWPTTTPTMKWLVNRFIFSRTKGDNT